MSNLGHKEMQGHKNSLVRIPNHVTKGKGSASVSTSKQALLQFLRSSLGPQSGQVLAVTMSWDAH